MLNAAQYVIVQLSAALEVCAALQRAPSAQQQQSIVQLLLTDTATAATDYVRFSCEEAKTYQEDDNVGSTHLALEESVQVQEGTAGEGLGLVMNDQ